MILSQVLNYLTFGWILASLVAAGIAPQEPALGAEPARGVWRERGFDDFIDGRFSGAGQNLYVSRAGVLQRIFQFDINRDGWFDLVFCNSQDHWEKPPAYVFADALADREPQTLPADGAIAGTVADLNADGLDDLVLGMWGNGLRTDLNAFIYFGSPQGYSERRHLQLPAPLCRSVAAGDFNGDRKCDLAFLLAQGLRVFYQSELGFEHRRYQDLPVVGVQIAAFDLAGDGGDDLVLRTEADRLQVYWGQAGGLELKKVTTLEAKPDPSDRLEDEPKYAEYVQDADPLAQVVRLDGKPHLFMAGPRSVLLIPCEGDHKFGKALELDCPRAMAVAVGDPNGDGHRDLILACRQPHRDAEQSWIYWGGAEDGYRQSRRTPLPSFRACDVAVGDLDADGCDEVVLCQSHTAESFSWVSYLYRGSPDGPVTKPLELPGEDARRVFFARASADKRPQVVLVNHMARNKLGNLDAFIYRGGPDGFAPERRTEVAAWGAVEALSCDLDDSGSVDLVLANASENSVNRDPGSFVFLGDEGGELPYQPSLKLPTTRAHGACCADLNRDGFLDLVFCGFDNPELIFFYGTGQGFDTARPERIPMQYGGVAYKDPRWIHLADLNNDHWLDLLVPQILDDRSLILWGGSDGFCADRCLALSVERAACARTVDLTGNGYLDLILGGHNVTVGRPHDSFVYIYWNGPEGLGQDRRSMLPAAGINSMTVADFNNDRSLDLFICSYHAGLARDTDCYLYWNRPGRGFSAHDFQRLFNHSASGCVAADFNEDGWTDLAVANHKVWGDHKGWSAVWWNGPDGFDPKHTTRLPTNGPHGITSVGPTSQHNGGPEEYYESSAFRLPQGAAPTRISWNADIPPKTWLKAQCRSAEAKERLAGAPWVGPDGAGTWFANGQAMDRAGLAGRWLQYRLALGAANGLSTPRVTEVSIEYARKHEPRASLHGTPPNR
jgi:hypothetical protein